MSEMFKSGFEVKEGWPSTDAYQRDERRPLFKLIGQA